ncbi:putative ROP binding protein kinases 1 [Hibiscus syriacus]|uniref:ROP binding protein kinases 1 n=1 Tax=Hibiscus syriacus TaxID=106335 RepID=A0A6A2ZX56_HIBSY|nr:putative ROP binding protein kinases 1 [Hibiscus syriacus]
MALLGNDGRGYDLVRLLESCGIWREWPGDSTSGGALLFDKATIALFLRSHPANAANSSSSSVAVSMLNPNYLQLHGDDVYFTLEGSSHDGGAASNTAPSKI